MTPQLAVLCLGLTLAAAPALAEGFEGAWTGTVDCPSRDIFDRGSIPARASVVNNVLTVRIGPGSVSGRIINLGFGRLLRLDGTLDRGREASFDGVRVTPELIHARGMVDGTPCNLNLTPAGATVPNEPTPRPAPPPQRQAAPSRPAQPEPTPRGKVTAPPPPAAAAEGKGLQGRPRAGATILMPDPVEPTRPTPGATIRPDPGSYVAPTPQPPVYQPPVAASPARPPASVGGVTPAPPLPPTTAPQVADRLACALAGTCSQTPAPR
ncbi:hypothetical protein C8P66_10962 [Humitalea rosea]|uniref:Uncharacterized protein n=1 Tax=Humitalea rosea TaxID=990373 RepID=A0A2W7II37_9PROT|nr:hypothetical protein [Humitalea rosea]PZW46565.1 hypothetical protein C8P66_10962 [Humitalea rosea]